MHGERAGDHVVILEKHPKLIRGSGEGRGERRLPFTPLTTSSWDAMTKLFQIPNGQPDRGGSEAPPQSYR
ncbi:hypothetical protein AVEN_10812-1 [Araneus ventricosus]|uniref:Uncharacterized protein n=1 Tax=Araneus ventricosus TaxID=182803 RepID=A0A4Y2SJ62_ARAVE|nr:hypothetical protein AVEN_10812-1 [Araneus ventricosus]